MKKISLISVFIIMSLIAFSQYISDVGRYFHLSKNTMLDVVNSTKKIENFNINGSNDNAMDKETSIKYINYFLFKKIEKKTNKHLVYYMFVGRNNYVYFYSETPRDDMQKLDNNWYYFPNF